MLERTCDECTLCEALDRFRIPFSVTVSEPCIIKNEHILDLGQNITILNRKNVRLLFGTDWNKKTFRMNTQELANVYADVVNVLHPKSLNELKCLLPNVTYILSKHSFEYKSTVFNKCEQFNFIANEQFTDVNTICLFSSQGKPVHQRLETLLNEDLFAFVSCIETLTLENIIGRGFVSQKIRFVNCLSNQVPQGILTLNEIHLYDTILTVTENRNDPSEQLLYEIFQLISKIKVYITDQSLPSHVVALGEYNSKEYYDNIAKIQSSMTYNIYASCFYGFLITEETFFKTNSRTFLKLEGIEMNTERFSTSDISRKWKSCNYLLDIEDDIKKEVSPIRSMWARLSRRKKHYPIKKKVSSQTHSPTIEEIPSLEGFSFLSDPITCENISEYKQETHKNKKQSNMDNNIKLNKTNDKKNTKETPTNKQKKKFFFKTSSSSTLKNIETKQLAAVDKSALVLEAKTPSNQEEPLTSKKNGSILKNCTSPLNKDRKFLSKSLDETTLNQTMPRRRRFNTDESYQATGFSNDKSLTDKIELNVSVDSGIDSPGAKRKIELLRNELQRAEKVSDNFDNASNNVRQETNPETKCTYRIRTLQNTNFTEYEQMSNSNYLRVFKSKSESSLIEKDDATGNYCHLFKQHNSPLSSSRYESLNALTINPQTHAASLRKKVMTSFDEISTYSIEEINKILYTLQLGKYSKIFKEQLVNGKLLCKLNEEALREMKLTHFEARKLMKYMHGWRINETNCTSNLEDSATSSWSVNDTQAAMKRINLFSLAKFVAENQVDGELLHEIVSSEILQTLEKDYGVHLILVERERLRAYINKELKYA